MRAWSAARRYSLELLDCPAASSSCTRATSSSDSGKVSRGCSDPLAQRCGVLDQFAASGGWSARSRSLCHRSADLHLLPPPRAHVRRSAASLRSRRSLVAARAARERSKASYACRCDARPRPQRRFTAPFSPDPAHAWLRAGALGSLAPDAVSVPNFPAGPVPPWPIRIRPLPCDQAVQRRKAPGGVINEYYRAA